MRNGTGLDDSFDFQRSKVFQIKLADEFCNHVHADAFRIRAFPMLLPQAKKFVNVPLKFLVD